MIVECSNCQTRFQLDESRIPARGIRVRCSRCKESFFLQHPTASKADTIDDVAEHAATESTRDRAPESTQDLPPESLVESSPDLAETDEEEDWEFNEDLPDEDLDESTDSDFMDPDSEAFEAASLAAEEAIADAGDSQVPGLGIDEGSAGDATPDAGSGLDLADDSQSGAGADAQADIGLDGDDDASDFGDATDFSALADEEQEQGAVAASPSPRQQTPAVVSTEDVGEPEDWDFFSDESLEAPSSMDPIDHAMGRAMEAIEADAKTVSPGPEFRATYSDRSARLGGFRNAGRMVGWLVTVALFGLGIARGVFDVATPRSDETLVVDLGDIQAEQISAIWLDTSRSTRLYAVHGRLVNDGARPVLAGRGTQVALLSTGGERLAFPASPAGLPLAEPLLRELSPDALAGAAAASAAQLARTRLWPGQAVDFQAFFDDVPDEAASFLLERTEASGARAEARSRRR